LIIILLLGPVPVVDFGPTLIGSGMQASRSSKSASAKKTTSVNR